MGRPESFDFGPDSADPDLASGQVPEFAPLTPPPAFEVPEFGPMTINGSVQHVGGMDVTDRRFLLGAALVVLVVHHLLRRWSR